MRYWDAFNEMEALRREVDRTFRDYTGRSWPFSRASFLPGISARSYPLINIADDKDHVYVEALAPGIDPQSLEVLLQQGSLMISGEKAPAEGGVKPEAFHRNERAAGKFIRTVELNTDVDPNKVEAEYRDGLLKVVLTKSAAAKPKQIEVKMG